MKEQISVLMDEEMDAQSSARVARKLTSDPELYDCWKTYHAIGDALRGQGQFGPDFRQRMADRLAAEPVVLAPGPRRVFRAPFLLPVAASVAAAVFVGWVALSQVSRDPAAVVVQPELAAGELPPDAMNPYLRAHHELAWAGGMQQAVDVRRVAYAGAAE